MGYSAWGPRDKPDEGFGLAGDVGLLARMKQPLRCVPLYRSLSVQYGTAEPVFDLLVLKEQKGSDASF